MRILVVDDDKAVRESLRRSLAFNGYEVDLATDGLEALDAIAERRPDAVVLDVMMPRLDGVETCRRLRSAGEDLPVLVLTARDAVSDRVAGLDAGADDYLPKPFALEELLARLRALLRRTHVPADRSADHSGESAGAGAVGVGAVGVGAGRTLRFADVELDLSTREVRRGDRQIRLTRTEFHLLELLLHHPRQVLSRTQILTEVWGYEFPTTANSLEVYVGYLRRKTEEGGEPRLIHTVRGVGYTLRETAP